MSSRTRYAQVGLGGRHFLFRKAIAEQYADTAELVGLCDINPGRLKLAVDDVLQDTGRIVPGYAAERFDDMVRETRPDCVIVTTKDSTHDRYVCRAMELGCNVITEKPMTIDERRCRRILDVKQATGRTVTVTFNYRYSPPRTQVKDLLMSGVIGDVLSVDFHWLLNTSHGADYYRRWHRRKENSGGLMVHKATHHFDLVNWWLSTVPERVYASGRLQFYTPETARRYGLNRRGERCHGCPEAPRCPFCLKLADNPGQKQLYLDCEEHDGYFRDRCVFSGDIDIEDSMNLVVDFRGGVKMTYSLNAFMPWEGHVVTLNGTKGRIEHKCEETVYTNADGSVPGALKPEGTWTRVFPHFKPAYEAELWTGGGGHGGADPVMLDYIFAPDRQPPDIYMRSADQRAGAWSIMTGVAANHSMRTGAPVSIPDLVGPIDMPDYTPMPDNTTELPLP